jgi:hypothetical protein
VVIEPREGPRGEEQVDDDAVGFLVFAWHLADTSKGSSSLLMPRATG